MAGKSLVQGRRHRREYSFVRAGNNKSGGVYDGMAYVHMAACGVLGVDVHHGPGLSKMLALLYYLQPNS